MFITLFHHKINLLSLVISASIVLTSIGVSVAYLNFISETLPNVFFDLFGKQSSTLPLSQRTVPLIVLPVILLLSYTTNFKQLALTSILGDVSVILCCILIIIYGLNNDNNNDKSVLFEIINVKTLPEYFGSVGFLFAIHIMILPILQQIKLSNDDDNDNNNNDNNENNNDNNNDKNNNTQNVDNIILLNERKKVINVAYLFITLFNAFFGFIGYNLYSHSNCTNDITIGPCGNILNNLVGIIWCSPVKILLCIDLLFTIPIVLGASRELIESYIFFDSAFKDNNILLKHRSTLRYCFRTVLVLITFVISVVYPNFNKAVSLVLQK